MADSVVLPQPRAISLPNRMFALIPGVLLLAAVGYAGKFIEQFIARYGKAHHVVLPNIEYVLWAILIGLIISNTIGVPAIFRAGVATYEFWLKAGIVLLGARFLIGDVLKLGGLSLALVFIEITLSLAFMTVLGRAFKLKPKLITLLAVGSSICGVSAIIATHGRNRRRRGRFVLRYRGHIGPRRNLVVHVSTHWLLASSDRSRIWVVGRVGGRQHR